MKNFEFWLKNRFISLQMICLFVIKVWKNHRFFVFSVFFLLKSIYISDEPEEIEEIKSVKTRIFGGLL